MVRWPNPKNLSLSRIKAARLAAARERHKPPDKKRTMRELAALFWSGHVAFWRDLTAITLGLVSVFGFAVAAFLLYKAATERVISIAPISVPQELATIGYTADVAAERLEDALNDIVNRGHSLRGGPEVARQADLPSIVVPSTSLSTETLAAQMRRFLRVKRRSNVSGEITIVDKKLWLRLRMNGRDLYANAVGGDPKRPDDLFAAAAEKIFEEADPYILAVFLSDTDPRKCLEIARRIISERPKTDPSVPWAYNLAGKLLVDQHNNGEAVTALRKTIELNPLIAVAHTNLGLALSRLGKTDDAIAEYRTAIAEYRNAIQLDLRDANLHFYLAVTLSFEGEVDEAIAEYRNAIDLDPHFANPHDELGTALLKKGHTDEAITEYQRAIKLEPRWAHARNDLGDALRAQGKTGEAILEYQKAIHLEPRDAYAHRNLSALLRKQGKNDAADAENQKAIDLEQKH